MQVYKTIDNYLQHYKPDDVIVLGGRGIMSGLKPSSKYNTYKVSARTSTEKLIIRAYKGRKDLSIGANYYDQEVGVLTKEEFKNLL